MAERVAAIAKASEEKQKNPNSSKQNMGSHTSGSAADMILQLQRTAGNQAVQRLIKSGALQTKLKTSQPNDSHEQKADQVTEQVMKKPEKQVSNETKTPKITADNSTQHDCPECKLKKEEKEKNLQTKKDSGSATELKHTVQQDSARASTVKNDVRLIPATKASSGTVANVGTATAAIPQPGMGLVPDRSRAIGSIPGANGKSGPEKSPEGGVSPEIKTEKAKPSTHEKGRKEKESVPVSGEKTAVKEKPLAKAEKGTAAPIPRKAIAPAISAVQDRATSARTHSPASAPVAAAQAAGKNPNTEQTRTAAEQTVKNLDTDAAKTEEVKRGEFKAKLKQAIEAATPQPKTEAAAENVMKTGAKDASKVLSGQLATERDAAAGPLKSAAVAEVPPATQPAPSKTDLRPEQVGAPPPPVSAAPVVPAPLPPERLDYSTDRASTDQAMAENNVTQEQLAEGNDPAFGPSLQARSTAEKHEATVETRYRQSESKVQDQAQGAAQQSLMQGLTGLHGARELGINKVVGQQNDTKSKSLVERQKITDKINSIKDKTREDVKAILDGMDTGAAKIFEDGLKRAEDAYGNAFEEAKGGIGTWLTTWGSDWDKHIADSLAKARKEYLTQVDKAIDEVADFVEAKLKAAKQRVADGRKEVEDFVKGLDDSVKQFGDEAQQAVSTDFDSMATDIDQRRDSLIDKMSQQYKESYERMSAMEDKLREENKSLWQRVYDATVGIIKKIVEFKNMLLGVLGKAAETIEDIIAHPIRFLGNLVSGIMQGLRNFMGKIGTYLQKGLMDWLFGALAGTGLQMPDKFDLQGIVSIVLQILGLTYANFRARAVAIVGEPVVAAIEKAAEIFKIFITEGVSGLWRFIKEKLNDLKSMVLDAIFDFIKERVIMAGITWIIGLLNPASAFFKACKAIYDIAMFFINRGKQIMELVSAVVDSVAAIAKGALGTAASLVENALAKAIPVAIGFLAGLLGLGDPSKPVRNLIEKARAPVNKAIDWVINLAVKGVKAVGKLLGFGKDETKKDQGPNIKLAVPFDMDGEGHTLYTEVRNGKSIVEMASSQRDQLLGLTAQSIRLTDNEKAKKRLQRVWDKLTDADKKVNELISNRTKDAETLALADKMTQDAANTLKGIGVEYGIKSLLYPPHKSNFVETTVTGHRIKKEHEKKIRSLFYPKDYETVIKTWKKQYIKEHTDDNNKKNFIDDEKRSEPITEATIDHQPRVVTHWETIGKKTTHDERKKWYNGDYKSEPEHLRVIAKKYNSSDGAEARNMGERYKPENVGKEFLGPDE